MIFNSHPLLKNENFNEYLLCSLIRNPYDWYESIYNYTKYHNPTSRARLKNDIFEYIDNIYEYYNTLDLKQTKLYHNSVATLINDNKLNLLIFFTQLQYLIDEKTNKIIIHKIFLTEYIEDFIHFLLDYISNKQQFSIRLDYIKTLLTTKSRVNTANKKILDDKSIDKKQKVKLDIILKMDLELYNKLLLLRK